MNELDELERFVVPGAGYIEISKHAHALTGSAVGFHFTVTWSRHYPAGGVLSRSEAIKLANHILKVCGSVTESEESEYNRRMKDQGISLRWPKKSLFARILTFLSIK